MSDTLNLIAHPRRYTSLFHITFCLTLFYSYLATPINAGHIRDQGSTEPWYAVARIESNLGPADRAPGTRPNGGQTDTYAILSEPVSITGPVNPRGLPREFATLDLSRYGNTESATLASSLPPLALDDLSLFAADHRLPILSDGAFRPTAATAWVSGGSAEIIAARPSLASTQWGPLPLIALVLALLVTGNYLYRTLERTRPASPLAHH